MPRALPNDIAALISFGCEAALWGAYTVLFVISLIALYERKKRTGEYNTFIVVLSCLLFASCTAHFALEFNHFYTTLWATGVDRFADETPTLVGADILISVSDLFGDFILIYRCWALWGKNIWVTVLPLLTAFGGFACAMQVMHLVVTLSPTAPVPPPSFVPLGTAGFTLPLCTNVLATGLIVFKIWWMTRPREAGVPLRSTTRLARGAMAIIVESGLVYLITQLVFVALYGIHHPAEAIVAVAAVQIYGIAPTLIIIRVALGIDAGSTDAGSGSGSGTIPTVSMGWRHSTRDTGRTTTYSDYPSTDLSGGTKANEVYPLTDRLVALKPVGSVGSQMTFDAV